jgi:hypothetical protein
VLSHEQTTQDPNMALEIMRCWPRPSARSYITGCSVGCIGVFHFAMPCEYGNGRLERS